MKEPTRPADTGDTATHAAAAQSLRAAIENACQGVRWYLLGMCGNWHEADEAAQQALAKAWARREQFDGRSDARTWIFAIARNHWLDEMRKRKRAPRTEPVETVADNLSVTDDPAAGLEQDELARAVAEAMASLPAEQREAVSLRESGALTFAEIARTLDVPVATVKSRVRAGLARLAEKLRPYHRELSS